MNDNINNNNNTAIRTWQSNNIPSSRKITHVLCDNANYNLTELNGTLSSSTQLKMLFYVSDDVGNVYRFPYSQPDTIKHNVEDRSCATCKRQRV